MVATVTETSAEIVRSSLPLLEAKRGELEAALSRTIRPVVESQAAGRSELIAGSILGMLLAHASRISKTGEVASIAQHRARHRQLGIRSDHYSRFGDGLSAVIKDALGAEATAPLLAAWGDTYWAIVGTVAAEPEALAA